MIKSGLHTTRFTADKSQALGSKRKRWSVKGTLGLIGFAAFLFYISIPIVLHTEFYTSLVLHPRREPAAAFAGVDEVVRATHQDIFFFNKDHDRLHAYFYKVPGATKCIVYHHGNAGTLAGRAGSVAAMVMLKANVFIYDYRGFGQSEGKASLSGILDDGLSAFDTVRDKLGFAPENIINYGESLGAGPAGHVSANRQCGGLILQSGVPSLPVVGKSHFAWLRPYPEFLMPDPKMDNIALVKKMSCPVIVIHGAKDKTIYLDDARKVYDAARQPKRMVVLKDSSHNNIASGADLIAYMNAIKETAGIGTR
jgi:fermentation-respiration switch protein FrsA (DUF1100 family)